MSALLASVRKFACESEHESESESESESEMERDATFVGLAGARVRVESCALSARASRLAAGDAHCRV